MRRASSRNDEFCRQCTYPVVQVFVLRWQQRESRYMSAACILYRLSRISERASRCSKLDVNRKWLADAKFHHSPTGRRNKRNDGEKGEERGRISYGNGARIACPFNRRFSLIVSKNDVSKEPVSIDIAISKNVSREMFNIYNSFT